MECRSQLMKTILWALLAVLLTFDVSGAEVRRRRRRNENIPTFEQKQYTISSVTADTKNNTLLIRVAAQGATNVLYSLDNPRLFRIDSDGNIYNNANGRRLVAGGGLNFTVFAVNPEHSHRMATTTVLVSGNQPPQFSDRDYTANVYESAAGGSLVRAVVAQDPDTDPISYFIRSPGSTLDVEVYQMFTINRQTGVIRLVRQPPSFAAEDYAFTVVARDTHNQNDTAAVRVHVIGATAALRCGDGDGRNENIPTFEQKQYTISSVTADTKNNTLLIRVAAQGATNVLYSLDNPRLFRIDSDGNIYNNANGRRLVAGGGLNFTVFAVNPEHSHRMATTTVLVSGNQPPQFSDRDYTANVYESAAGGSLVRAVVAQDPDTDPISYFIRSPGSTLDVEVYQMFTINRQTGVIRLVRQPPSFAAEDYAFTVVARDTHNQNDTAAVRVHVIDVNNNRPVFTECDQYRPEVAENKGAGTAVLRVEATDA
ncbi:cadherin-23-like [Pollicipes pollicipes]|uniref:cadherin-23-like n=1 Tax=Pollicipes pollicipes TaxID=41117 RepID=UPI001884E2CB|nr:cadherin-23-like [Pollicipes pollicipes]